MNEPKSTNPAVILLQEILQELKSVSSELQTLRSEIEAMNQNLATSALAAAQPATPSNNGSRKRAKSFI